MIEISRFVIDEMNKFSTLEVQEQVKVAKEIYEAGLSNLVNVEPDVLARARALPKGTEEEKLYRKAAIKEARERLYSKRMILKNYPDGIEEFDITVSISFLQKKTVWSSPWRKLSKAVCREGPKRPCSVSAGEARGAAR